MDENKNDTDKQPQVIQPDGAAENSDTSSTSETHDSENVTEQPSDSSSSETSSDESSSEGASSGTDTASEASDTTEPVEAPAASESSDTEEQKPETADAAEQHDTPDDSTQPVASETPAPASTTIEPTSPSASVTPSETPAPASSTASDTSVAPTVPSDDIATPSGQTPVMPPHTAPNKKLRTIIMIVGIVVVIAIIAIVLALVMGNKKTPTTHTTATTGTSALNQPATKVNSWTGKGNSYAWDTAANWSLGVPTNGETLAFNTTSIKPASGTTPVAFQDNIPSLSVNKIIVEGTGTGFTVSGSPITVTGGISSEVTQSGSNTSSTTSKVANVEFNNALTLTGDQAITTAANNVLTLSGVSSKAITTIGSSTVKFVAAKTSAIEISTPIVGTGEIEIPASTTTTGNVDFNVVSPNFTGNVMVNSGATAGMGNENPTDTSADTTGDAFGTAAITIASGGYLEINETTATSFTVPNNVTVAGNGATSQSQDNGAYTGAISSCITSTQEGCGAGATVTFTGKVNLTSNTEFGAFFGTNAAQTPTSTTVTYVLKNVVDNAHTLTAVADSKAVVQVSK